MGNISMFLDLPEFVSGALFKLPRLFLYVINNIAQKHDNRELAVNVLHNVTVWRAKIDLPIEDIKFQFRPKRLVVAV